MLMGMGCESAAWEYHLADRAEASLTGSAFSLLFLLHRQPRLVLLPFLLPVPQPTHQQENLIYQTVNLSLFKNVTFSVAAGEI